MAWFSLELAISDLITNHQALSLLISMTRLDVGMGNTYNSSFQEVCILVLWNAHKIFSHFPNLPQEFSYSLPGVSSQSAQPSKRIKTCQSWAQMPPFSPRPDMISSYTI